MKKSLTITAALAAIFSLFCAPVFAQKFTLKGVVADSLGEPLESATVMLMSPKDSSLVQFSRSKALGIIELRNVSAGRYLLRATYLGYHGFQKMVEASGASPVIDLGKIQLVPNTRLLNEAVISAEANPVNINKDTIEFRAASFKVQPNATVEDLLKKMPGIEVERDGTIKAQGEEVRNVLVEGKKFFGNDPKIATQNLPADAVEKVQVYDQKSETATFTGVDDGQKEKTINLDLKEDKKHGWFGKLTAGAGNDAKESGQNDARFTSRANLNRFTPSSQLSFLGLGNNVNEPGFSFDDYMQFSGAMRQMMGGSTRVSLQFDPENMPIPLDFGNNQGFLETKAGGVNFNREFGKTKKSDLNGSYFFSDLTKNVGRSSFQQSLLPGNNFTTSGEDVQENQSQNHRLNFGLEQKIDSFNALTLNANFLHGKTGSESKSTAQTLGPDGQKLNENARTYLSDGTSDNLQANFNFRHKFKKKGRNTAFNADFGSTQSQTDAASFSENKFFAAGDSAFSVNQNSNFKTSGQVLGAGLTFNEPLGRRRYLEFRYNFNQIDNQADRRVFDLLGTEQRFNESLSNAFESRFNYHRAGAGFRVNRKSWNGSVGFDAQAAKLSGEVISGTGQPIERDFKHLLPRANFQRDFGDNRNLRFDYSSSINAPTVRQLQPVADFSNPLSISEGNPDLKPEFAHNLNLHFTSFNPENFRSFFIGAFMTLTQDKISSAQNFDNQFVRTTKPVNTPLDYNFFVNAHIGLPAKKWKSRFNLRSEFQSGFGQNFLNDERNSTRRSGFTQVLEWQFDPAQWFTSTTGAEANFNRTSFSLDGQFDQNYLDQTYFADATVSLPKDFSLTSSMNVVVNTGRADGFNQTIPIWNASVSKFLLPGKRLEIALVARDLLDRNTSVRRNASLNFVEDERVATLSRYFLLRATYSLQAKAAADTGPSMRVMIRR